MVKMKKVLILLVLLIFAVPAYAATVYKWVDREGIVNYTDDIGNVPQPYRNQVEIKHYLTEGMAPAFTSEVPSRVEAKTDLYGRDETWWKEKVHPWKEQLREATENYDRVQKEYMVQAEGLSPFNFGKMSLTQYQMLSARLEILRNKMDGYQGQIAEANEMLSKLSNEAREAKADPVWLE
jgi:chromosome segregation ATPase